MKRCDTYNILHVTNYAALCIAILRPTPVTIEDAFDLYESGVGKLIGGHKKIDHKERLHEMVSMREAGFTWPEIGGTLGLKAPMCYFSRHKYLLQQEEQHGK